MLKDVCRLRSVLLFATVWIAAGCSDDSSGASAGSCDKPQGPLSMPVPPSAPTAYSVTEELVVDQVTGLAWQRKVTATLFSATDPGNPGDQIQKAKDYCASLVIEGHADFRLPTRFELVTIQDHSRANPSINPDAFPDTPPQVFWSSTRQVVGPYPYFAVSFSDGGVTYDGDIQGDQRVRCVRTASSVPAPAKAFTLLGGVARDERTGLVWERATGATLYKTSAEGEAYCKALAIGSCGGFRLPTAKELNSIVDESRAGPALDPETFPAASGWYWTSTEYARTPGFWMAQSSGDGVMYPNVQADGAHARCVM